MKKAFSILFGLVALLVLSQQAVSCTFRELDGDLPQLNIYVHLDQPVYTKATEGDIDAISDAERAVKTLQIWVFKRATGYPLIAYLAPSTENINFAQEKRFSTYISKQFAQEAAGGGLDVDVYVLANAASAGLSFNGETTHAQLEAAVISGAYFAPSTLTASADITTNGLPMSCVRKDLTMTGSDLSFTIPTVTLKRAVSKVRFVLCQQSPGVSNFRITNLQFDQEMFPQEEPVFNQPTSYSSWVSGVTTFLSNEAMTLPTCNDCSVYLKGTSETPQQYEDKINQAVTANALHQIGPYYFRETTKKITGKIEYTYELDGVTQSNVATFRMADEGDFTRNHSWTIYGYLRGVSLYIYADVVDWELKERTTSFIDQIGCENVQISGMKETGNHYMDNSAETTDPQELYAKYYQIRTLKMDVTDPHFVVKFKPFAPLGGYWMLSPEYIGEGSSDKFDIRVWDGVSYSNELIGQIMNMEVELHIYPKNYVATDETVYAMILKSYFSPNRSFDPLYSADSEFQDVHGDGRYSYWRFTLSQ